MVFLLGCQTGISNLVCLKQNAVFSPKCILISCPIAVNGITIYPVSCTAKTWKTFLNPFPLTSHIKSSVPPVDSACIANQFSLFHLYYHLAHLSTGLSSRLLQ